MAIVDLLMDDNVSTGIVDAGSIEINGNLLMLNITGVNDVVIFNRIKVTITLSVDNNSAGAAIPDFSIVAGTLLEMENTVGQASIADFTITANLLLQIDNNTSIASIPDATATFHLLLSMSNNSAKGAIPDMMIGVLDVCPSPKSTIAPLDLAMVEVAPYGVVISEQWYAEETFALSVVYEAVDEQDRRVIEAYFRLQSINLFEFEYPLDNWVYLVAVASPVSTSIDPKTRRYDASVGLIGTRLRKVI